MADTKQHEPEPDGAEQPAERKAYTRPEVVAYGSISKLTQSGGATRTEFIFARRRRN
jgi:hypothetical protein